MPLFGKSNSDDKHKLVETVGPVPEGYHVVQVLQVAEVGHDPIHMQTKVLKDIERQCNSFGFDGFCNYKTTASSDGTNDTLYAYADGIKSN